MKNILIPTDFSKNAQKAIDYAIRLFEKEAGTFYVLHAYHDVPSSSVTKPDIENDLKKLAKKLEAKRKDDRHTFEAITIADTLMSAINMTAIDNAIDYIFMGTQGSSAIREIFMGSNTASTIKHLGNWPIVAVPSEFNGEPPEEIVFANDYRHSLNPMELKALIHMVSLWDSSLLVVHINKEKEALKDGQKLNKELLKNALRNIKHRFTEVPMEKSIAYTLNQLQKENDKIGMVALLKTKHGFFENLFREPVIRNLSFQTQVPLLVLPQTI